MSERKVETEAFSRLNGRVVAAAGVQFGTIVIAVDDLTANADFLGQMSRETRRRGFNSLIVPATADLGFEDMTATVPGAQGIIILSELIEPAAFSSADRPVLIVADHAREDIPLDQLVHDAESAGYWA